MPPKRPSAGKLHIGSVIYYNGVFSAEMLFIVEGFTIGEDHMKSAGQAAARHFYQLLHQNGFRSHGEPEVVVKKHELRSILFYIACKAQREQPRVITIRDPEAIMKEAETKPNGDGGD
jgi:exoribonuclease R